MPQRDKGQEVRDKDRSQRNREKGKGAVGQRRTKDCLCIERRQTQPIGKGWFIKVKGKAWVRLRCLIFN